jgi:hypothetical protein
MNVLSIVRDSEIHSAEYALRVNDTGILTLGLPYDFPLELLPVDGMIDIMTERIAGEPLEPELETAWFIRRKGYRLDQYGIKFLAVTAFPAINLINRRIIPYGETDAHATYTGAADDGMKDIMRHNFGSLATDALRSSVSTYLSIQQDYTLASSIDKAFSYAKVIDTLQGIANDHYQQYGVFLAFDVVRLPGVTPPWFEFRTYIGQRGINRGSGSAYPLIFSEDMLNIDGASVDNDWTDEYNSIYASGQGQEAERIIQTYIADRSTLGPFSRTEFLHSCQQAGTTDTVKAEAYAASMWLRPRLLYSGVVRDSSACAYGIHWNLGDKVVGSFEGFVSDCRIDAVSVMFNQAGSRQVSAYLESEAYYE